MNLPKNQSSAFISIFILFVIALCWAPAFTQTTAGTLIPALRLERIERLAQSYADAPDGTLVCPRLTAAPKIDGDLSDWPAAAKNESITLGAPDKLEGALRTGWDTNYLYIAVAVKSGTITPANADDLFSGDVLELTLLSADTNASSEAVGDGHSFVIVGSDTKALLLQAGNLDPVAGENLIAYAETNGQRAIEMRLPWNALVPATPFGEQGCYLSAGIERRDTTQDIDPAVVGAAADDLRLVLTTAAVKTAQGYLQLANAAIPAGEMLESNLLVEVPQPLAALSVRVEVLRIPAAPAGAVTPASAPTDSAATTPKPRPVNTIMQTIPLSQGLNALRIHWDSAGRAEGDYLLQATGTATEGQVFLVRAPFRVAQTTNIAKALDEHSKKLAIPVVIAKIQKAHEANPAPLKFAVMGDPRDGEAIFTQALAQAAKDGAQFALVLGDLVASGQANQYLRLAKLLEDAPLPVLVAPGNHDYHGNGRSYYQRLFGKFNYTFELGGYRFIVLDNAMERLTPVQLDWLETQLQGPLPKFVFAHTPPNTISKWAWHSFSGGAERFTALMEKYKPVRVFLSHIHAYDRATQNGVEYVLTGGAGAPLYNELGAEAMIHNYVLVEAGPDGITDTPVVLGWQKPAKAAPAPTTTPSADKEE